MGEKRHYGEIKCPWCGSWVGSYACALWDIPGNHLCLPCYVIRERKAGRIGWFDGFRFLPRPEVEHAVSICPGPGRKDPDDEPEVEKR